MTCPSNMFKKGARCYVRCKAGYTNNGETCGRAAHDLGMGSMTCRSTEFRTGARCYTTKSATKSFPCDAAEDMHIYHSKSAVAEKQARCLALCLADSGCFGVRATTTGRCYNYKAQINFGRTCRDSQSHIIYKKSNDGCVSVATPV